MKILKTILKVIGILLIILATMVVGVVCAIYYRNWARSQNEIIDEEGNITVKEDVVLRDNVTFLGIGVNGALTDFIMLGQYNPNTREVSLMSIPRDTKVSGTVDGKINSAYLGVDPMRTVDKVYEVTGIKAEYYVLFNTKVLRKVVDAVDGVTIDVPINMNYDDPAQDLYIHLKKGTQKLTGKQAEQFVRFRKNNDGTGYVNGDVDRVAAQQKFIKAMVARVLEPQNLLKINQLFDIVIDETKTNLTLDDLLEYTDDIITFKTDRITIGTLPGHGGYAENGLSYYFWNKNEVQKIIDELFYKKAEVPEEITEEATATVDEITKSTTPEETLTSDKIKIEVLNGGVSNKVFSTVVDKLNNAGYYVSKVGNKETSKNEASKVICNTSNVSEVENLQKLLGISKTENNIEADATVHYTILLGPMYEL